VLWIIGLPSGTAPDPTQSAVWILLSTLSALSLAAAHWVSWCCAACALETHVHLAAQLRATVAAAPPHDPWATELLANVGSTHGWLAAETSRQLRWYAGVYVLNFAFVGVSGLVSLATDGVRPGVATATATALGALSLLAETYCSSNARRTAHLLEVSDERLRAQLRHDLSGPSTRPTTIALASHQLAISAIGALGREHGRTLGILGVPVTRQAARAWMAAAAVALGVCIQAGLERA